MVSLCFYFQQLLDCNIQWVLYGDHFKPHIGGWSDKVKNKIVEYDASIDAIKNSDIIIYQQISKERSSFCNTESLQIIKKESCKLILVPYMYFKYSDFNNSIEELKKREIRNKADICVSDIYQKYKGDCLMLGVNHPTTFLFLEVVDEICKILHIDTFSQSKREVFLKKNNYMELP
jgi:hypothetical protein